MRLGLVSLMATMFSWRDVQHDIRGCHCSLKKAITWGHMICAAAVLTTLLPCWLKCFLDMHSFNFLSLNYIIKWFFMPKQVAPHSPRTQSSLSLPIKQQHVEWDYAKGILLCLLQFDLFEHLQQYLEPRICWYAITAQNFNNINHVFILCTRARH